MVPKFRPTTLLLSLAIAARLCCQSLAQTAPPERFRQLDKNADGKLTRAEVIDAAAFAAADADKNAAVTPDEFRRYVATRQRLQPAPASAAAKPAPAPPPVNGQPALKQLPDCDAVRDAAGMGQLFEGDHVRGITDVREGMNGFARADLNRDGRPDLIATFSPPSSYRGTKLVVLINEGSFRFTPHAITIGNAGSMDEFGGAAQIANLADFNDDGFLDILVTRSAPMLGGKVRRGLKPLGVAFLLSDGAWDRFEDVSERMGARNELGYNRQTSIGDVNGDGWLDRVRLRVCLPRRTRSC